MKYFKKFVLLGIFALFGVGFSYGVFAPSGDIIDNNNLVNSQCSGHITLSNFNQTTNGVPIFDFNFVNGSICDSIINNTTNTINIPSIVCGYFDRASNTSSATATLVGNAMGNSYWNIKGTNYVSLANSHCVFVRTGNKLEFGMSNSFNLNNISGWTFGYTIMPFDTINTYFQVPLECSQYTSLQCQTEYNLIPIEDVTKNYCEVNFDLIDPLDCPSSPSSGSGDVSRSALYIDNVQYSGAPNIYININDLLEYSMTYVSGSAVIDVNGYSYDTGYMADILTIQEYHPTSEDFTTSFVSFLTFALPYVVVILFVVFVRKLIRKIFKF